jgi:DNA-binding GntR family transcriptional regulator
MDTGLYTDSDTPWDTGKPGMSPGSPGHAAPGSARSGAAPADTAPGLPQRERAYQELRRRLMAGEFPGRSRLVEERIAAVLGVSRTPVREALARLLNDGLVYRGDGGYYVTVPNFADLRDLYELRITLELRGVARARDPHTAPHDVGLLEPLRDQWREMLTEQPEPSPEFVATDEDFHVTLSRAAGNTAITQTLITVNARIRPVRMYDFLTEDRIDKTIREHLGVVEAVLAGQLDDAEVKLRQHVGVSMEVVEQRAARAITQMALRRGEGL